jgi:hypothetical protein
MQTHAKLHQESAVELQNTLNASLISADISRRRALVTVRRMRQSIDREFLPGARRCIKSHRHFLNGSDE